MVRRRAIARPSEHRRGDELHQQPAPPGPVASDGARSAGEMSCSAPSRPRARRDGGGVNSFAPSPDVGARVDVVPAPRSFPGPVRRRPSSARRACGWYARGRPRAGARAEVGIFSSPAGEEEVLRLGRGGRRPCRGQRRARRAPCRRTAPPRHRQGAVLSHRALLDLSPSRAPSQEGSPSSVPSSRDLGGARGRDVAQVALAAEPRASASAASSGGRSLIAPGLVAMLAE